jgi:malate dehydrogenase
LLSIIGTGRVGSATAFLAAASSLDNIHLVNRHKDKAIGQALDISNAIPEDSSIYVKATDYSEIKNSEVIVITASTGTYTASRTELLSEQAKMIKDIAKKVKEYAFDAKVLIISNPVDVLTYLFQKESRIPRERVMGVASSLDSSRFRYLIAQELETSQDEIKNALVLGEHGDSMVPLFSFVKWNEKPILECLDDEKLHKIIGNLRFYWRTLRAYKGPSIFGIAKNTFDIIKSIKLNQELSVPVSVLLEGEYGISDACLGIPVKINKNGVSQIKEIQLDPEELDNLHKSANAIKEYIKAC